MAEDKATLERQLSDLTEKMRWLMDRAEIQDLLNAYARAIDHRDLELLKQVYHSDAIDEHGIFSGSGDEFARQMTSPEGNSRTFRMMQHHHTTTSIDIRGDDAEVETYFFCVCARHDGVLQFTSGRCADKMQKRDERWGVLRRQVIMDWTMQATDVTPTPTDARFAKGRLDLDDLSLRLLPRLRTGGFHGGRPWREA